MPELEIELKDLRFFAHHGLHPEEKKIGAAFSVDVFASFPAPPGIVTRIDDTVDYSSVFEIIREEMARPRELLETLVMEMVESLHSKFPQLTFIRASVVKLHPPIAGLSGNIRVSFTARY